MDATGQERTMDDFEQSPEDTVREVRQRLWDLINDDARWARDHGEGNVAIRAEMMEFVEEVYPEAIRAAALADHDAEPWRALVEDFVCWLDSAPDDRATFGADMDKLDAIARRARAALSGDTIRSSGEEEATGG